MERRERTDWKIGCALAALLALAGCGGGGGGGGGGVISTPAPVPTPTPTPAPTPTPTPPPVSPASFDTAEFRRSDGPGYHNAPTAWAQGATGSGVKIAVIDTGIDTDSPEFAGRIDPASADVAGNGTVEAVDDHGTNVAMIAAAARNNTGIVGIAYNATIVALRADRPGSCTNNSPSTTDGCVFSDRDIAAGVDRAVSAGATVINLSLGGSAPGSALVAAVQRAAAAGTVVVVAAGNEGDGSDADVDPNQPNPFATGVRNAGGSNVIIAGSVNDAGQFSAFSNKAGSQASFYLSALGERVCCVYENGVLKVEETPSGSFVTVISGTSFSAPQIAGAVALLKQAFPNLSGTQIVDILLSSARDAGAAGTDTTYGRGILDIAAAFAPRGATTLAGGAVSVPLNDDTAIASTPMGDALAGTSVQAIILDSYGRAYGTDLGGRMQRAGIAPRLHGALDDASRRVDVRPSEAMSLSFSIADRAVGGGFGASRLLLNRADAEAARVLAGRAALRLSPGRQVAFGFRESADGLVAQLQGHDRPAFLIAGEARGDLGFTKGADAAFAFRQQLGPWGVSASAERGEAWLGTLRVAHGALGRRRETKGLSTFALSVDRKFGAFETAVGLSWLDEDRTVLGSYFHEALGGGGARTLFADASATWRFSDDWRLGGALRQGWTRADRVGTIGAGSNFVSRSWSLDVSRKAVFSRDDSFGVRLSQPLRVESGGLALNLPVGYDYATLTPTYGTRFVSLAPGGNELDGEIAWAGRLFGGSAMASLFYRRDPGHLAATPDDKGVALRWSRGF